jgi:hypothetical protein
MCVEKKVGALDDVSCAEMEKRKVEKLAGGGGLAVRG